MGRGQMPPRCCGCVIWTMYSRPCGGQSPRLPEPCAGGAPSRTYTHGVAHRYPHLPAAHQGNGSRHEQQDAQQGQMWW